VIANLAHNLFEKYTPSATCCGGGLNILVVNSDLATAETTAVLLHSFGHRVRVASDGQSAWQAALGRPPDVVLLELTLPDLDGWEMAERLQEPSWEKKPFLIALADYDSEEDRCRSRQAGIDLHLVKPVDPDYLRRILERFCRIIMPSEVLRLT
jgi:DNA-binding response OmpR family regulator